MSTSRDNDAPNRNRAATASPAEGQNPEADFVAPLGAATAGRLVFPTGAAGVTLHVDPTLASLCRAHFERHLPTVQAQGGAVTIRYPSFSLFNWLVYWREPVAEVTLTAAIPWQIEIQGGVSKLTADLRGLRLMNFSIDGGASGVLVMLPAPMGSTPIQVGGGASNVTFRRPAGVAVRVRIQSGASNLTLDERYFGAVGGETRWETPDARQVADHYDIRIGGGASNVTVGFC
ncbi:MAG: hypothetical protein DCC55_27710 [Chloroflexi bacterium]|nr:MAG: hypothetical protein DCC55_27710 [Chloroflexota bacterium]